MKLKVIFAYFLSMKELAHCQQYSMQNMCGFRLTPDFVLPLSASGEGTKRRGIFWIPSSFAVG